MSLTGRSAGGVRLSPISMNFLISPFQPVAGAAGIMFRVQLPTAGRIGIFHPAIRSGRALPPTAPRPMPRRVHEQGQLLGRAGISFFLTRIFHFGGFAGSGEAPQGPRISSVLMKRLLLSLMSSPGAVLPRAQLLTWLLALVLMSPTAWAQGTATLRGTVVDSLSGQPVAGVSVGLQGQPGGTATDALGNFRLGGITAGTYTLRVGALGYRAQAVPVTLAAGETRRLSVALPTTALNLSEVTVSQPRDPN